MKIELEVEDVQADDCGAGWENNKPWIALQVEGTEVHISFKSRREFDDFVEKLVNVSGKFERKGK